MLGALAVLSFAVTYAALRLLVAKFGRVALDRPNERSLHEQPGPRPGGIALLAGAAVSLAFGVASLWLPIVLAAGLAVLSFMDDVRGLHTGLRLAAHLAAAGLLVWYLLSPMHPLEMALLWPLWVPLLVFAPFIGDATLTLLRRLARGERVWQAHREHYYQRLVRMGAGHRGAALMGYGLMLICAAAQVVSIGVATLVLVAAAVWIDVRWARHSRRAAN
jgi:UDP-N-acetylmuramyl pentapeptide phosphotransferase/UDP-N-acetylglucosamine-1-phosphate transferase